MCNKMLDSTNNNAKDNALYCKVGPPSPPSVEISTLFYGLLYK